MEQTECSETSEYKIQTPGNYPKESTQCTEHGESLKSGIILIYLLTAIRLTPGGSSTVNIYTQTIHRTTQLTTLVGRLSGIRRQCGQTKINDELTA